jgi:hypothetical protein
MRSSAVTVTIASPGAACARQMLAENLSVLLARDRRKVLLLDTDREQNCLRWGRERAQAHLRPAVTARPALGDEVLGELNAARLRYDDIVIDTGAVMPEARRALIAAQVALVVVAPSDCLAELVDCLNNARMFNPGLRMRCVVVAGETGPLASDLARGRAFADRIGGATVAATCPHVLALAWGAGTPGQCASDLEECAGGADLACLYRELYPVSRTPARFPGWRLFRA